MKYVKKCFENVELYHSSMIPKGIIVNANENNYGVPEAFTRYMEKYVSTMDAFRYPDTDSKKLINALASTYDVLPENITIGVGSDELLDSLLRATIDNDYVLICNPSFSMYTQFTFLSQGKSVYVPMKSDFSFDVEAILKQIDQYQPKVTFICSPNNPTGSVMKLEDMRMIASKTKGILAIDEAYVEFSKGNSLSLLKEFQNVIIFRTFSKAYALAGIRVGYAISSKDLIDTLKVILPPYNVSKFSQEAAYFAITNRNLFLDKVDIIIKDRENMIQTIQELGIEVYPSNANFIWMALDDSIVAYLEEHQIFIRKMVYNGKKYNRITVGTTEENKVILDTIKEAIYAKK